MKIFFANYRSGAGISIRAAINALLNRQAERAQTAGQEKKHATNHAGMGISRQRVSSATRGY
jgi:hypothetical protein